MSGTPPLALTMGDACGIGPEIVAKACRGGAAAGCVVIGDPMVLRRAARATGGLLGVAELESVDDLADVPPRCIPVLRAPGLPGDLIDAPIGRVDARAGAAAARCIEHAVALVRGGALTGLVTAPIHKEALAAAGIAFPGHTEMLQALAAPGGTPPAVRMMLANDELRTVLVTIHMALRAAIEAVTLDAVLETLRITQRCAAGWGVPQPRMKDAA